MMMLEVLMTIMSYVDNDNNDVDVDNDNDDDDDDGR